MGNRMLWIDNLKGIMLLFVLIEHIGIIPKELHLFVVILGGMAMPCYFAMSGYLFSTKKDFNDFLRGKLHSLLFPYLFLSFILLALDHNLYLSDTIHVICKNSEKIIIYGTSTEKGTPLWFVFTLFLLTMCSYMIVKYTKRPFSYLAVSAVALSILAHLLYKRNISLPFNLNSFFAAYPYFIVGFFIKSKGILDKKLYLHKKKSIAFALLLLSIQTFMVFKHENLLGGVLRGTIPNLIFFYMYGLLSITSSFIILNVIKKGFWLFVFIAKNGMTILAFHAIIQIYSINILKFLNCSVNQIFWISFFFSLLGTFLLSFIFNKYAWTIIGGKRKKNFKETLYNI